MFQRWIILLKTVNVLSWDVFPLPHHGLFKGSHELSHKDETLLKETPFKWQLGHHPHKEKM